MRDPRCRIGELAAPQLMSKGAYSLARLRVQICLPLMFTATTCPEPNTAYTRSPSTTGLALARLCLSCTVGSVPSAASSNVHARAPSPPFNRVFHAMFSVSLHDSGSRVSLEAPVPAGPRHCGQLSADTEAPGRDIASVTASQVMRVATLMNPPGVCFSETLRFASAESNRDAPESATPPDPCTMCA